MLPKATTPEYFMAKHLPLRHVLLAGVFALTACAGADDIDATDVSSAAGGNTTDDSGPVIAPDAVGVADAPELAAFLSRPLGQPVDCNLSLSEAAAMPGEVVAVTGLPGALGEPSIRVLAEQGSDTLAAPLFVHDLTATGFSFTVPMHPTGDLEGGTVRLEVGDGAARCPDLAFTINPLPDADPGLIATVQENVVEYVEATLTTIGYDPDALMAMALDDVEPADLAAWLALQYSRADRPGSLLQFAREARGNEALARVLAASGILEELQARTAALSMRPAGVQEQANPAGMQRRSLRFDKAGACQGLEFDAKKLSIASAAELSARMKAVASGNNGSNFNPDRASRFLGANSLVSPLGGSASGFAGVGVFAIKTVQQAEQALEPRRITDFSVQAQTLWVEDRDPAMPLRWENATVNAEGESFNLAKTTLEGLITALGLVPGPIGASVTLAGVVAPQAISDTLDAATQDSCFRIAAPRYGPIIVNDEQWTTSEIRGSTFERVNHRQYRGIDIGASELRVSLNTDEFPPTAIKFEDFTIVSDPIQISLSRSKVFVDEPGSVEMISATAINATTDKADFVAEAFEGFGTITSQRANGDFYDVTFQTPAQRERYPAFVRFVAQHRTLPQGTPMRIEIVEFDTKGELTIEPRGACLLPGQTLDLTAEIVGFQPGNQGVMWSAEPAANFSADDELATTITAPSALGPLEVTVTSTEDDEVSDTVTLTVSDRCTRKQWVPIAAISAPASGTQREASEVCGDRSDPGDNQIEELRAGDNDLPSPPDIPPQRALWFDRMESIQAAFVSSVMDQQSDDQGTSDPADDSCSSVSLAASADGSISYTATTDDTLALDVDVDFTGRCERHTNGNVVCEGGQAAVGVDGLYYLDLSEETTYRMHGSLECSGLAGGISILPITATVQRFTDGTTPFEPNEEDGTKIRDPDSGQFRSPQLFEVTCTEPNELVFIDERFTLDAPQNDQDLIVISILGNLSGTGNFLGKQTFEATEIPFPPQEPAPGDYNGSLDIHFEVTLDPN